ncbi:MAG: proteasome assembly chaperone family protein [Archaeoglobi archaeon]|nr:proteasome assembly chaperone family protein [Archaeoglobi archaeon]
MDETRIYAEKIDVESPIILTSFPGIGLVGTIATGHFIVELNLEPVGVVESKLLPPIATLNEGIIQPPIRIYQCSEKNFVLIHSDVPIHPSIAYELSSAIIDWATTINAKRIVSLAGLTTFEDKKRVFGAATSKEVLNEIREHVEIFRTGTISGIAGSLLNECFARKFPAFALLGETGGFNPDPRAAAEVINTLNKIYSWDISVEKLIKEAEFIEAQMQKLAEQTQMQETREEYHPMYG